MIIDRTNCSLVAIDPLWSDRNCAVSVGHTVKVLSPRFHDRSASTVNCKI